LVELSEPKITVLGPQKIHASVRYRYLEGRARPGVAYKVFIVLNHGKDHEAVEIGNRDGATLKSEGLLESEIAVIRPIPQGATISYEFMMGAHTPGKKGPFGGVAYDTIAEPLKGKTP
jgi:hypothetical protein